MTSLIISLHHSLEITPADNDHVKVTVTLPSELLNDYARLLDSLSGFVNAINHQKHHEKLRAITNHTQECQHNIAQHHKRIVRDYDGYIAQGLSRSEAIKQLSADLRKEDHPWCSVDLVRISLIKAGRPGRIGRPPRGNS